MTTILLGGYYGAGNAGDEAILTVLLQDLRQQIPTLNFIVLSWDTEKTSTEHNVESIFWKDIDALLDAALRSDLILLGGGGIFHDYWGIDPSTYLRKGFWDITSFGSLPLLAKLLNIPCVITAVGVGPFKTDLARQHTRLAFERCLSATVRDKESLDFLIETGFEVESVDFPPVKIVPDIVFRLEHHPDDEFEAEKLLDGFSINKETPLLGISLRYWDTASPLQENLFFIAQEVKKFLNKNQEAHVIMIPFQVLDATSHTNDVLVLRELAEMIEIPDRVHVIETSIGPRLAQALIKRCRVLIGMRLHSIIMGINVGTPAVSLAYAPKVQAVMRYAGLEEYSNSTLLPEPDVLETQLQKIWDRSTQLRSKLLLIHDELSLQAQEHSRIVIKTLLDLKPRLPLQLSQEFALQQTRFLLQADEQIIKLQNDTFFREQEKKALRIQLRGTEEKLYGAEEKLNEFSRIEGSRFWKIAKLGYRLTHETRIRYIHRFFSTFLDEGIGSAFEKVINKLRLGFQAAKNSVSVAIGAKKKQERAYQQLVIAMLAEIQQRSYKGVFVLTSAFVFDELYNQRVINFSKFLSRHGWGVIYVAWRWHRNEPMPSEGKEVYKNIFQIPIDVFLANIESFSEFPKGWKKYFFIEFPNPDFFLPALNLRSKGFNIIYEIIDEWDEFHRVGQAAWFDKAMEDAFVINANIVTAVSLPLIEKFSFLRKNIYLSPNGYSPALLGETQQGINYNKPPQEEIQLGYFGHLTSSWFDWEFLASILELANSKRINIHVHLIGYGDSDWKTKMAKYSEQITFYGAVHPSTLYQYVKNWHAAFIFFKPGKLSQAVDPIKIYEYLYFGIPVLVTGIEHLRKMPFTEVVTTASQALNALVDIQKREQEHFEERTNDLENFLAESTWEQRFEKLLQILEAETWMFL